MFVTRPALPNDVPAIVDMIRELADYEKLLHEAKATVADVTAALFGPRPVAEALVAETEVTKAAFALFFSTFSTFVGKPGIYLEDIYVRPQHRGQGIGKALFRHIARLAVERGCGRLEWSVLDWNEPALAFYRRLGATPMSDWTMQRLAGDALAKVAADRS
jgi:GNAT superfamily N-acetyltransferase